MLQEIVIKFNASPAQIDDASESNLHAARAWARELGCEIASVRVDSLGGDAFEAIVVCADCSASVVDVFDKYGALIRCVRPVAVVPVAVPPPVDAAPVVEAKTARVRSPKLDAAS